MATPGDQSPPLPPPLSKHFYIFKDILEVDPEKHWKFCQDIQRKWEQEFSKEEKFLEKMVLYRKVSALTLVWVSDKLDGKLPDGMSQQKTYRLLSDVYDLPDDEASPSAMPGNAETNAETGRVSQFQLKQHVLALKRLLKAADEKADLSEELIKSVHRDLMKGLKTDEGEVIKAGQYRSGPVSAGQHAYPAHDCIPENMKKMVENYNRKLGGEHDMFQLASWLLFDVVSLHPFEDGNGRLCRLLWCFSLIRDGLPFPLTLSTGHCKAHNHYVKCVIKDRNTHRPGNLQLTSLTVVCVKEKWDNFISNLQFEYPEGYERITEWLKRSGYVDL